MEIKTNGQRNITLDFNAPKKFRLVKDGAEIPYIRTGKNSFRLSKPVDGFVELEEIVEQPRYMQPVQLQPQQMTVINPQDVDRLNEAVRQMALVNPQDVMIINQTAEQLEKNQNFIAQTQKEITNNQAYIDQQQQRLNETALGIQALETDNSQRLDGTENAILNLAGEISNAQNMAVDGMNTALNKIEEQGILLQNEIDTKADKDELESLKKDFEEKSDRISSAMANYSGGTAYDTLPQGGEAGQILAKRTDRQGDYVWIDQTPVIVKSETIPTASEKYKGEVYQYVGETGEYTHGYIYECQEIENNFVWVRLDVQPNTAVWGQITGTLSDQTDLQEAFDTINSKIPAQASSSNQLTDKDYVDTADNDLQQQIDAITAASDVTDVVGTYAQLQAYDTSSLPNNSIIKVLQDESRNDETTYYRWVITAGVGAWVLIGEEGPYYTKAESDATFQEKLVSGTNIKTINGSSVLGSGDLSVTAQAAWGSISGTLSNQTDLQNALNAKQDIATAVNYDNITNCITEIPQDIKLELNNGTLTLKAGSKVYVPNGAGVYNTITISSDISLSQGWGTSEVMLLSVFSGSELQIMSKSRCVSGSTDSLSSQDHWWYNTTNNTIRFINSDGTVRQNAVSLPIAIITMAGDGSRVTSIDQVFNGFGYIGSTVFVLPGVKGLIPNGRNADGSLKNIEFSVSSVFNRTYTWDISGSGQSFAVSTTGLSSSSTNIPFYQQEEIPPAIQYIYWYKPSENIMYTTGSGTTWYKKNLMVIGQTVGDTTGKITTFKVKTAFHAADYNDVVLKTYIQVVSALPANPDSNTFYFIPE